MKHYVGPKATAHFLREQNPNFRLLDYVMGGWVPAPGNNENDNLVRYGPWVPYGPHNTWPFRPVSLVQEVAVGPSDNPGGVSFDSEYTEEEEELLDRIGVPPGDPRHRDSIGGTAVTPGEAAEIEREEETERLASGDERREPGTIQLSSGGSFSRHTVMPGIMMPWLSRRARREILWNSCLRSQGVTVEEAEEGFVVPPSGLRQAAQVVDMINPFSMGTWVGDAREPMTNRPRCNQWGQRNGWGAVLAGGFSDAGSLDLDPGGDGWEIGGSNQIQWRLPLISNNEARAKVRRLLPILVNQFLRSYGPWTLPFTMYTEGDFSVANPQGGWGSSGPEPATAVSGWMKSRSMFKNHAS
jgi:hypothetical protein